MKTQFIDASGEDFFKKETNNNVLTDDHIKRIMEIFDRKTVWSMSQHQVITRRLPETTISLSQQLCRS